MGQPKPTEIDIKKPDKDTIRHLEWLLDKAKSGNLTGIVYVAQWHGFNFSHGMVGINMEYVRTTVGEIEILKQQLINENT